MGKKWRILESVVTCFDLPAESLLNTARVTLTGPESVLVENHQGLRVYDSSLIEIDGGRHLVRLRGEQMQLCYMTEKELLVRGQIYTVDLE
jgi:sporulation protein YqfC